MNLRWLWFDYIDPALNLSKAERKYVRKRASATSKTLPLIVIAAVVGFGTAMVWKLFHPAIEAAIRSVVPFSWLQLRGWTFFPLLLGVHLVWAALLRVRVEKSIRRAVRELGYEICTSCGYWLRGLGDEITKCPECGAAREKMPEEPV